MSKNMDEKIINCIRALSMDAIQKANSGHPGITMGAAPMAYKLFKDHLKADALCPDWIDRDRFVLSAGHGSMLLYAILHLFGYKVSIDDIKQFRQFDSITPGHPEYGKTPGVDASTGPLGQGFANAVGMAMAEAHLAARFNKPGYNVIDHYSYALCGDGCMMEGISSEAASLAGTLKLGKLIVLYDSNNISIEGSTDIAFTENVRARFDSFGWHTLLVEDGNDLEAIDKAIKEAKSVTDKPSLIEIKTIIGYGSPNKAGSNASHGAPLGEDEIIATKKALGWEYDKFEVPEDIYETMAPIQNAHSHDHATWDEMFNDYAKNFPKDAEELRAWFEDDFVSALKDDDSFWNNEGDMATRAASEKILNKIAEIQPNLFGGSADLSPSNKSVMKNSSYFSADDRLGNNIHFGVREMAMTAIANGMLLHGGVRSYIATFFVFSDYLKPILRVASISSLPTTCILSHDSVGVGEDGPTHQPIEQIAVLRSMPNFRVFRPCDINETAAAWYTALSSKTTPTAMLFTRQTTKNMGVDGRKALKGGYILKDSTKEVPDAIIIATGSEVSIACDARDILLEKGVDVRVVSMPCVELFEEQSPEYKNSVLPLSVKKRVSVEASSDLSWYRFVGIEGKAVGMREFGKSAPYSVLFKHYGFTPENIAQKTLEVIQNG